MPIQTVRRILRYSCLIKRYSCLSKEAICLLLEYAMVMKHCVFSRDHERYCLCVYKLQAQEGDNKDTKKPQLTLEGIRIFNLYYHYQAIKHIDSSPVNSQVNHS